MPYDKDIVCEYNFCVWNFDELSISLDGELITQKPRKTGDKSENKID
jgi:hypothetical protein